jgi:hypothetical protein
MIQPTGKRRTEAISKGFKSALEMDVAERLKKARINFVYEPQDNKLEYTLKEKGCVCANCGSDVITSKHKYLIDFQVKNIVVESKGIFSPADRTKMIAVREANPQYQYVIILQAPNKKITKKTTYTDWCNKNNFVNFSFKENFEKKIKEMSRI